MHSSHARLPAEWPHRSYAEWRSKPEKTPQAVAWPPAILCQPWRDPLSRDRFRFSPSAEVSRSHFVGLERKSKAGEALQRGRETIDGIVGDAHRAVSAFVPHLKTEIDDVFFADLEIVGDFLALGFFTPAAFVEGEFGIDEIAMILEEPVDAI